MALLIGLDISTTATKALLMDDLGTVLSIGVSEYDYSTPHPLWVEQDPGLWWQGAIKSVSQALNKVDVNPNDVVGIGITGQMHGLVLLDQHGEALRPALLWNDQRTGSQCDTIRERIGKEQLISITGNDALTGFTAPKILWVQENESHIYEQVRHILLPKDYVRYQLTGTFASDKAGASGTLLFDIAERNWSPDVLDALNINPDYLPETHEGTEVTGTLSAKAAKLLGLPPGIPVVGGGGDQAAQAVGVGAVKERIIALTLGTSGIVFASSDKPVIEPEGRLHAFCHAFPNRWHMMGVMLSAAGSLRWLRDTIAPETPFANLVADTQAIKPGSDGLIFLPYLTGERTPYPDPLARGAFVGLTVRHTPQHMTRAVLEGVGFGLRDSLALIAGSGLPEANQIRISGGGARSQEWRQILANILNAELVTVNTTEGAAFGAALLAGVGTGIWPDTERATESVIQITGSTLPEESTRENYNAHYQLYKALYPALKPANHALAALHA